ncbi:nuclease-related domain-containing protein [Metabacillus niabensis]|uniref:NERD domain-containing protein n=1 Tax=Metabacillus niabensis TaxID=324854 RepID=A0ABT9ZAN9_9BACI|nr:nuclease-related domain-containing protein [Metabacillus niabensis]MDQ0228335.1 hypothetical protein [Metabacillus niabensis]
MFSKLFKKGSSNTSTKRNEPKTTDEKQARKVKVQPNRIGDIGEYKINIQLDQLPKDSKYLSDILIPNPKSKSGYSQIDHIVFIPYAVFIIETKNYQGTIYGGKDRKTWSVDGKYQMMNPFHQNYGHISALKKIAEIDSSNIVSMISFTKRCTFKVDLELRKIQSNELIVYDIELSEFISRKLNVLKLQNSSPVYSEDDIEGLYQRILKTNITDNEIRERHVQALKSSTSSIISSGNSPTAKCKVCGTPLTVKVKEYCLTNKERFNGEVYCFEHQKQF